MSCKSLTAATPPSSKTPTGSRSPCGDSWRLRYWGENTLPGGNHDAPHRQVLTLVSVGITLYGRLAHLPLGVARRSREGPPTLRDGVLCMWTIVRDPFLYDQKARCTACRSA